MDLLAPGTTELGFGRVTLDPGASVPFDPNDASAILVYIASGAATFRVDAEMTVAQVSEGAKSWNRPMLEAALAYEQEHAKRKGAVAAIESALAAKEES